MYIPILPGSGLTTWSHLQKTQDEQVEDFAENPTISRDVSYFKEKLSEMTSVEDLVSDYNMLRVALGAHGLQDDIQNRYFVRQVIEQGTQSDDSFALRLSDTRYRDLAATFEELGLTGSDNLLDTVLVPTTQFGLSLANALEGEPMLLQTAVGLNQSASIALLGASTGSNAWDAVVEDDALVEQMRKSLGIADSFYTLTADQQASLLQDTVSERYGSQSIYAMNDPANVIEITDRYLGTEGQAFADAFSVQGLKDAIAAIDTSSGDVDTIWQNVLADTALRDSFVAAYDLPASFYSDTQADQIATLKAETLSRFGTEDFTTFSSLTSLLDLSDQYLTSGGAGRTDGYSIAAFEAGLDAAVDTKRTTEALWETVLEFDDLKEAVKLAFDMPDNFDTLPRAEAIELVKAASLEKLGTDSPEFFEDLEQLEAFTRLHQDAQIAEIAERYAQEEFKIAVGEQRDDLRVALSLPQALDQAISNGGTEDGQWYLVIGSNVLGEVFQTAYGLPDDFPLLDVDEQVRIYKEYTEDLFGSSSLSVFSDSDKLDELTETYVNRAGLESGGATISSPVLNLFSDASATTLLNTYYYG
ncbi:MAG: DUF1217 domain-containing protein [Mangrovicoccus sp.]